jgi:hypothetical protein
MDEPMDTSSKPSLRAKRFPIRTAVRYREIDSARWHIGRTKNLSCSGALIAGRHRLAPSTPVELILPLPSEISGKAQVRVLCSGSVVRVAASPRVPILRPSFAVHLREVRVLEEDLHLIRTQLGNEDWRRLIHEMFNEIAVVVGSLELLDNDEQNRGQRVAAIKQANNRVVSLLQRLTDLLRKQSGQH